MVTISECKNCKTEIKSDGSVDSTGDIIFKHTRETSCKKPER